MQGIEPQVYDFTKEKCREHPEQALSSLCLTDNCSNKLLCVLCLKSHPKKHDRYHPIPEVISEKHIVNAENLLKDLDKNLIFSRYSKFFLKIDKLFEDFDLFLNGYRNSFLEYVLGILGNSSVDSMTEITVAKAMLRSCMKELAVEGLYSSNLDDYIGSYKDILKHTQSVNKTFQQSIKKVEDVAQQVDKALFDAKNILESSINLKPLSSYERRNSTLVITDECKEEDTTNGWQFDAEKLEIEKVVNLELESGDYGLSLIEKDNLAVLGGYGQIYFMDLATMTPQKRTIKTEHEHIIDKLIYLKNVGYIVASSGDFLMTIWNYEQNMSYLCQFRFIDAVYSIEYIEKENYLVCGGYFSDLYILTLECKVNGKLDSDGMKSFQEIKYIPERDVLAAYCEQDGAIWMFDWAKKLLRAKVACHKEGKDIGCLKYNSTKKLLYSCGGDGIILVWEIDSLINRGKPLKVFKVEGAFIGKLLYNCNKDGDFAALCKTKDETRLVVWNLKSDKPKKIIKLSDDPAYLMLSSDITKRIIVKLAHSASFLILKESASNREKNWWPFQNSLSPKSLI